MAHRGHAAYLLDQFLVIASTLGAQHDQLPNLASRYIHLQPSGGRSRRFGRMDLLTNR
jgi:hypothetical protein